jgi:hypothetical protein
MKMVAMVDLESGTEMRGRTSISRPFSPVCGVGVPSNLVGVLGGRIVAELAGVRLLGT